MAEQSQKRSRRKKKERIPRQSMPVRLPEVRNKDFDEVPLGYTPEMAQIEAQRCLQCAEPKCVEGCPVHIKIPEFIQLIVDGEFSAAAKKIKENNTLPAVCGRVCPQEEQCEQVCILGKIDMPVAIGRL